MAKTKKKYDHPGQPTKYKPEFCNKIIEFFDVEPWDIIDGKRVYKRRPTIEGFAKSINVGYASIYNWIDPKHASFQPEFLESYNKAKHFIKNWLIDVGLSGLAPANSFKFVATNVTDMRDQKDTNLTGNLSFTQALDKAMNE